MAKRSKKNTTAPEQAFIEAFFRGIWQIIVWIFSQISSGKKPQTDKAELEALREHWEEVELHVMQASTRSLAVSEADKILDTALKILGFSGATMADRLRASESRFGKPLYNEIWQAHKLRNALAHEVGAKAGSNEAQHAISIFRQALYKLGVLS